MLGAIDKLTALLGSARVFTGEAVSEDDWHDESLHATWHAPDVVVLPHSATEVAEIITIAREFSMHPVVAHAAAQLLRADSVRLWHYQALFKAAGGRITDTHQDQP